MFHEKSALPSMRLVILVGALFVLAHQQHSHFVQAGKCSTIFNLDAIEPDVPVRCDRQGLNNAYQNIPILNAVYCFNNGTGICKALAGRFEFYLNSWTGEVLGPVESSRWVDSNGYHYERVPISYMVNGEVLYADRPINWAIDFTQSQRNSKYNLLLSTSFNWCKYATTDNWPYKSAIKDHEENTTIYFFNRQSCIYKKDAKEPLQHFNTRFMGNSKLRIDLDYNPTIFAMEDDLAEEIRLVKAHRQHWYEVSWKTVDNPLKTIRYFVNMDPSEKTPCRINSTSPRLILATGYKKFADKACVSDYHTARKSGNNARLVQSHCGLDKIEIADYLHNEPSNEKMFEVGLHNIPRWPFRVQVFYGVTTTQESEWEQWAEDGLSFSATTTIEIDKYNYRVLSLFSTYVPKVSKDFRYDENYPKTFLSDYTSSLVFGGFWSYQQRKYNEVQNLNYVDDIAYLHTCKTVLIILGPLYTEIRPDEFTNPDTRSTLGPINELGAYEPVSAFFAKDADKLYFYHRLNYVAEHRYTCAGGIQKLVTADSVKKYYYRHGKTSLPWMQVRESIDDLDISEESAFQHLKVYKGEISAASAPDPTRYEWTRDRESNVTSKMPDWIWSLVVLGILALVILFTLGFIQFRRRIRRRQLLQTVRSEMPDSSVVDGTVTNRSALSRSARSQNGTIRSGAIGRVPTVGPTIRSASRDWPGKVTLRSDAMAARENSGSRSSRRRASQPSGTSRSSRPSGTSSMKRSHATSSGAPRSSSYSSGRKK